MAPHSSTLAWEIPWTGGPGRLQSMGSLGVGHDWATSLSLFTFMHWRRQWQPTPVFLPGESQGRGAWWAAVHWVAQSRTRLKRLRSSSKKAVIYTLERELLSLVEKILRPFSHQHDFGSTAPSSWSSVHIFLPGSRLSKVKEKNLKCEQWRLTLKTRH